MSKTIFNVIDMGFREQELKELFGDEFSEELKNIDNTKLKVDYDIVTSLKRYIDDIVRNNLLKPKNNYLYNLSWKVILSYNYERRFNRILKKYLNNSLLVEFRDRRVEYLIKKKKHNEKELKNLSEKTQSSSSNRRIKQLKTSLTKLNDKIDALKPDSNIMLSSVELQKESSEVLSEFLDKIYNETQNPSSSKTNILNNFDSNRGSLLTYLGNRLQSEISNRMRLIVKRIERGEISPILSVSLDSNETSFYDKVLDGFAGNIYSQNDCLSSLIDSLAKRFDMDSINQKLFLWWKDCKFELNNFNIQQFIKLNPDISSNLNIRKIRDRIDGTIKTTISPDLLKYYIYKNIKFTPNFLVFVCEKEFYSSYLYKCFSDIDKLCENVLYGMDFDYDVNNCTKKCLYERIRKVKLKKEIDKIRDYIQDMFKSITNNKSKDRVKKELEDIFYFLNLKV